MIMTDIRSEIIKDIAEIYGRLFDHKPFLSGEVNYFLREFEEKRNDIEIENLFTILQKTTELKDSTIPKCISISENSLEELKKTVDEILDICTESFNLPKHSNLDNKLAQNRADRSLQWDQYLDDINHKKQRIENTFEEKEEELREFYSDLEQKLHIHN